MREGKGREGGNIGENLKEGGRRPLGPLAPAKERREREERRREKGRKC